LITALCRARGVTSDSLTYESLSPAIKKNYWNVDDLTINFSRARKARVQSAGVSFFFYSTNSFHFYYSNTSSSRPICSGLSVL